MKPKTKIFSLALPIISTVVWVAYSWFATDLMMGVQERTGCTDLRQFFACFGFPQMAILVSVVPSIALGRTKYATVGNIWCMLIILLVIPAALALDGGM